MYTPSGVAAQAEHSSISGLARRTHYCGAYWGWGFHEDGVRSAVEVAAALGVRWPEGTGSSQAAERSEQEIAA